MNIHTKFSAIFIKNSARLKSGISNKIQSFDRIFSHTDLKFCELKSKILINSVI